MNYYQVTTYIGFVIIRGYILHGYEGVPPQPLQAKVSGTGIIQDIIGPAADHYINMTRIWSKWKRHVFRHTDGVSWRFSTAQGYG